MITTAVSLPTKSHWGSLRFHFSKTKDEIKQPWIWPANNPPERPQETHLYSLQLLYFQWEGGQGADSILLCIICISVSLLKNSGGVVMSFPSPATTTGKSSLSLSCFDSIFTAPPVCKRCNYLIMAEGQNMPIWGIISSSYSSYFCLLSHCKLASIFPLPNVFLVAWDYQDTKYFFTVLQRLWQMSGPLLLSNHDTTGPEKSK